MQLKVAHKSSMLQKTRAHSATIAEKNAAIKKLKQEAAGFHEMYFENVDEVDDARKYAQDMVKESVKEIHLSKKCTGSKTCGCRPFGEMEILESQIL